MIVSNASSFCLSLKDIFRSPGLQNSFVLLYYLLKGFISRAQISFCSFIEGLLGGIEFFMFILDIFIDV